MRRCTCRFSFTLNILWQNSHLKRNKKNEFSIDVTFQRLHLQLLTRTDVHQCGCDNVVQDVPALQTFSCKHHIGMDRLMPMHPSQSLPPCWPLMLLLLLQQQQPMYVSSIDRYSLLRGISNGWCVHFCCRRWYCIVRICIGASSVAFVHSTAVWSMWSKELWHSFPLASASDPHCYCLCCTIACDFDYCLNWWAASRRCHSIASSTVLLCSKPFFVRLKKSKTEKKKI